MAAGFSWPIRIYYEDTDAAGLVYYANYLKFMERARTEWLRSLGFEQDELMEKQKVIFTVRSICLDYLRPAHFNDELSITAKIVNKAGASLTIDQEVFRLLRGDEKELLCEGRVKLACLDAATRRPRSLPLPLREAIRLDA